MAQRREKTFEYTVVEHGQEKKKKATVKYPTNKDNNDAQLEHSRFFAECLEKGVLTSDQMREFKKEDVERLENGMVDIDFDLADLQQQLEKPKGKRPSAKEGREIALEMRRKRNKQIQLRTEYASIFRGCAENMAEDHKFEFLISRCTFNQNDKRVYNSYEEYMDSTGDILAIEASRHLAELIHGVVLEHSKKLPESKFLLKYNMVDSEGRLINKKGEFVDSDMRLVDADGYYINEKGQRLDEDGEPIVDEEVEYVDDWDVEEKSPESDEPQTEKSDSVVD